MPLPALQKSYRKRHTLQGDLRGKKEIRKMTIFYVLAAASIVSSILVISAGMLSSRINREENWVEVYEQEEGLVSEVAPQSVD
jgi:hypothetical protein